MSTPKQNKVVYLTVDDQYAGQRIDNFLISKLKGVPRTHIYRILRKGEVRVNKKRSPPSYKLQVNDSIRIPPVQIELNKPLTPSKQLETLLKNRILFEDKAIFVINKPSGIAVHAGSGVRLGLVEALKSIYPEYPQLELVHRLDAETSGCLILAKKRSVLRELHGLMREGKVGKSYLALTKGLWLDSELRVDLPLKKNVLQSGERMVKVQLDGKTSLTLFKVIETYPYATLVEATLLTGRTHQIRVHALAKGHPIAGDDKYGDDHFNDRVKNCGLKRLFLHSTMVDFTLPSTGQYYQITAPLDDDLKKVLASL